MKRIWSALFPRRWRRAQAIAFGVGALSNLMGWWYVAAHAYRMVAR